MSDPGPEDAAPSPGGVSSQHAPPGRRELLAVGFALLLASFALFWSTLDDWWTWDDPMLLKHVLRYGPFEHCFDGESWRRLSTVALTPWLCLSWELDVFLAGLHPAAFHVHNLLAVWLAACFTYRLLRHWTGPGWAAAGAALLLSQHATQAVAHQLMSRHYTEGLLFSALALDGFVRAVRSGAARPAWWGALAFFFAAASKEVYVPLPLLLPLIPEGRLAQRLRHSVPYLLVLGAYVPWRLAMLGGSDAGRLLVTSTDAVFKLLAVMGELLLGDDALGLVASGAVLALLVVTVLSRPRSWLLVVASLGVLMAPLAPIARRLDTTPRALLPTSFALAVALAVLCGSRTSRHVALRVAAVLVFVVVVLAAVRRSEAGGAHLEHMSTWFNLKGRFIVEAEPGQALLCPDASWYELSLVWLRGLLDDDPAPTLVMDPIDLVGLDLERTTFRRYDEQLDALVDVSSEVPGMQADWLATRRKAPLLLRFQVAGGDFYWAFGPYTEGAYTLVDHGYLGRYPIERAGVTKNTQRGRMDFRLRYEAPEGWVTYSPRLVFDGTEGDVLSWGRR